MDVKINEVIVRIRDIENKLIACYQADSICQTAEAIKLGLDINNQLLDCLNDFSAICLHLMEKDVQSRAKLKTVK